MTPPSNAGALVVDANIFIAVSAKEVGRQTTAQAELITSTTNGYQLYAPGVAVAETLYILCQKVQSGALTPAEHALAVQDFVTLMNTVLGPPRGDASLIVRAEQLRVGYGCSRSADGIYLALAEELCATRPTRLLTFDRDLPNQAARHAPAVNVHLLT
jgi:predicted nucleic acid-binding protein